MRPRITDVIAALVLRANPELEARFKYQEEALRETPCKNPSIGRWIDATDVEYLLSTFVLEDKDFAARLPALAHVTLPERRRFVAAVEAHLEKCPHCALKRGYELELDAKIDQACRENRDELLQMLEEEEADAAAAEDDHRLKTFDPAFSTQNEW